MRVAFVGTLMVNVPSVAVATPLVLPLTITLMPGTPLPCASVTFPETGTDWETARSEIHESARRRNNFLELLIMQFFVF
jgi:hypothetical protein